MENTKAKKILIIILIILLLICVGFLTWQHIQIKKLSENMENVQNGNNSSVSDENVEQGKEEVELEDVKSEYSYVVEHAINKNQPRASWSECGNEYLHINVVAPKININTENVKLVNQEIFDRYNNMSIDTTKGGYNIEINYTYKYVPSRNLLFVLITERYEALCATGNIKYNAYIYNTKNDKFLTLEELLELYNITKNDLIDEANNNLIEHISGGTYQDVATEQLTDYKERIENIVRNQEMTVMDLENERLEIYFPVDLEGLRINI